MKRNLKAFLSLLMIVLLVCSGISIYASSHTSKDLVEGESVTIRVNSDSEAKYIPNNVLVMITPYSTYYEIMISNDGIDYIDTLTLNMKLYDNVNGSLIDSNSKTFTKVKTGTTIYDWNKRKSNTVEEKIVVTLTGSDGGQSFTGAGSTVRWNFVGGAYGRISSYGGQVHHCPADSVNGITTYSGPAIRMLTADHKQTASYGRFASAQKYRAEQARLIAAGKFDKAMQMDIDDIRDNFGSKYNRAIAEMINYAERQGYISVDSVY